MARTAASFCVFLTLVTLVTLVATVSFLAAAFRAAGFAAAFPPLAESFGFVAAFFAVFAGRRGLADFRTGVFAVVALWALGLDDDFALTARFAFFDAGLAFERDVDRLKLFVRLLLMGGISKGCSPVASSRSESPGAYHRRAAKSTSTSICGCFNL
jgi:hypothetical protein